VEELTRTGARVFEKIEFDELETERRFRYWVDKFFSCFSQTTIENREYRNFQKLRGNNRYE
jgi:hypothetical protein